jgi:2-C-methyl-D-erythritol 4-phosphate cytidylyltransferase
MGAPDASGPDSGAAPLDAAPRDAARDYAGGGCCAAPYLQQQEAPAVPLASPEAQALGEAAPAPDTCAIILAGGSGERFGDPRGKQFVDLCGLPLMSWSIMAFDRAPSIGHLVVVYPVDRLDDVREVLSQLTLRHDVTLATAGATRQDSVFSGLIAMPAQYRYVAIHDGARPLIQTQTIEKVISALRNEPQLKGAIAAAHEIDTLKLAENGLIIATPDRNYYWVAQTPQVFRTKDILAAHRASVWDDFVGTDDASLIEHRGGKVRCVDCPRDNIKVTVPEDLAVVAATLEGRLITGE